MASGWSQYAVMVRRCNTQIWGAGLFGHDGTMWGQDGLPLKTTVSSSQKIQKFRARPMCPNVQLP